MDFQKCGPAKQKSFFQSLNPLRGVAVVPQLVESALRTRTVDPKYKAWFDDQIAAMVRFVRDNSRPAPGEKAAPLADVSGIVPFDEAKVGT